MFRFIVANVIPYQSLSRIQSLSILPAPESRVEHACLKSWFSCERRDFPKVPLEYFFAWEIEVTVTIVLGSPRPQVQAAGQRQKNRSESVYVQDEQLEVLQECSSFVTFRVKARRSWKASAPLRWQKYQKAIPKKCSRVALLATSRHLCRGVGDDDSIVL